MWGRTHRLHLGHHHPVSVIITVTTPVGILARASTSQVDTTELIPRASALHMPIRGNKRVFVQRIANKLHIKHKQALEFVNAYSGVVMQGVREDGFSLLPDIGSLARGVRNLRSQGDKDEATRRSGGGTANRKYKKAYLKFAPKMAVRRKFEEIVDVTTWNPKTTLVGGNPKPRWREPKPASMRPRVIALKAKKKK